MLMAMVFAGALLGSGLVLILRGAVTSTTPLASVVAELHRAREVDAMTTSRGDHLVERLVGRRSDRRRAELAVCERSDAKFVQDRALWALIFASGPLGALLLAATGTWTAVSPAIVAGAAVAAAAVGWWYAVVDLHSDAVRRRREFRHALAGYLELVTILMAGGAGVETALYDAAAIGRGTAFRHIRTALSASQARREPPWATLGHLGDRLGIHELQELEAAMILAGGGAQVRESLTTRAESIRMKDLAQMETEAQARSETMVLPVAMMFAGFLLLIGYPALAALSAT